MTDKIEATETTSATDATTGNNQQIFHVENEQDGGDRLDAWLAAQISATDITLSRSRIAELIRAGNVTLNGNAVLKPKRAVHLGDQAVIDIPPPRPVDLIPEDIPLDVLYEDEHMLVINKPTNLVVHPTGGHQTGTLVHALLHHCTDLSGISGVERPGIVHRLDKDTTGIILVAKNDEAHLNLQSQFAERTVNKQYRTIVAGKPKPAKGQVETLIGRCTTDRKRMAVNVPETKGGKNALTFYETEETFQGFLEDKTDSKAALLRVKIATGRTHQIRVHMQHIGHCILGDHIYNTKATRAIKAPRQMLHAAHIQFQHPISKETMTFDAPLPEDMEQVLQRLRAS